MSGQPEGGAHLDIGEVVDESELDGFLEDIYDTRKKPRDRKGDREGDAEADIGRLLADAEEDIDDPGLGDADVENDEDEAPPRRTKKEQKKFDEKFSEKLIERAKSRGFSEADMEVFRDEAGLERALDLHDRRLVEAIAARTPQPGAPPRDTADKGGQDDSAGTHDGKQLKLPDKDFKVELSEEDADPAIVNQFNKLNEHLQQRLLLLDAGMKKLVEIVLGESVADRENQFDGWLKGLDDQWQDVFGQGSSRTLTRDGEPWKNRVKVYQFAETLRKTFYGAKNAPDPEELFGQALRSVFPDKYEEIVRDRTNGKVRKHRRQQTMPPSGSRGRARSEQDTIREIGKIMRG